MTDDDDDEDDDRERKREERNKMWDGTYKKNVIVRGTIAVIDTNFARKHTSETSRVRKKKKGDTEKERKDVFVGWRRSGIRTGRKLVSDKR